MSKSNSGLFFGTNGERLQKQTESNIKHKTYRIISNPVVDGIRVGSALKKDSQHSFPDIVDNYVCYASSFVLIGGDGEVRILYQLEGCYQGKDGIFEWIVTSDNKVSHRRFIPNGKITGSPNQKN